MRQLEIAVIADNGRIPKFGLDALDAVRGHHQITVFSCTTTPSARRRFARAGYGALQILATRNEWTRSVPVGGGRHPVADVVEFASGSDGDLQTFPPEIVDRLRDGRFDVAVKLGMGPVEVPPADALSLPILAFHYGDPEPHRGRLAGFCRIADRAPVMQQLVVRLVGDGLDAGPVLAAAETRVVPYSYRATLTEAYRHSPLLLDTAIRNALSGTESSPRPDGPHPRIPTNLAVGRFATGLTWERLRRLAYGAAFEKKWRVSTATAPSDPVQALHCGELLPSPQQWRTIDPLPGYVFYADPFFSDDPPGILVEALRSATGHGELLLVQGETHSPVSPPGGHFSYPATVRQDGRQVIVPETASWAPPTRYVLNDGRLEPLGPLAIDPDERILDPTLVEHGGKIYLFGNPLSVGSTALYIWVADSLSSTFRPHPMSPVLISPRGARMAGGFVRSEGALIRFGQDSSAGYGHGLYVFLVDELSPTTFHEQQVGEVRFTDRKGPHTFNVGNGRAVFDWYQDRFAPLAGVRRFLARETRP